jgi:hypothetical protein
VSRDFELDGKSRSHEMIPRSVETETETKGANNEARRSSEEGAIGRRNNWEAPRRPSVHVCVRVNFVGVQPITETIPRLKRASGPILLCREKK